MAEQTTPRPEEKAAVEVEEEEMDDPEFNAEIELAKSQGAGDAAIAQMKHQRLKKLRRKSNETEEQPAAVNGIVTVPRSQKNRRQSRNGKGRGEPKKEGGGGKYTWGRPGQDYLDRLNESLDPQDPNYDSDAQVNVTFDELDPVMGAEELNKACQPILEDFFENGAFRDAVESIKDLDLAERNRWDLVRQMVLLAVEKKSSGRELASELLAQLIAKRVLFQNDVGGAFEWLLNEDLAELTVDYPNAAETMGNYIARAIADLALPHDFIEHPEKNVTNSHAMEAMDQANVLLKHKNRLHDVWGVGGRTKPVRYLVRQMQLILQDYLSSGDSTEAERTLRELEVPHFNHELVFQAGVMAIEAMHDRISHRLSTLLRELYASGDLTQDSIKIGFTRLFGELGELSLDVPPAYTMAERWTNACKAEGFVSDDLVKLLPQRGRKRFVSEGDGGRLKVIDVAHPLL